MTRSDWSCLILSFQSRYDRADRLQPVLIFLRKLLRPKCNAPRNGGKC